MKAFFEWVLEAPLYFAVTVLITLVLEYIYLSGVGTLRRGVSEVRKLLYADNRVSTYLKYYYSENNSYHDLFSCTIGRTSQEILFLSKEEWCNQSVDVYKNKGILIFEDRAVIYRANLFMVWIKKHVFGQRLINSPALYLVEAKEPKQIVVGSCDYYQKLTLIGKLERELLLNVYTPIKKSHLRDQLIKNYDYAIRRKLYPISIGCDVALVINYGGKRRIAMHERSHQTSSYGGRIAVVPSFGFCPISMNNGVADDASNKHCSDLLLYNIIKEYCEEIFNKTELECCPDGHADPFWFFESVPEAQDLLSALESEKALCKYLGFGFDAINGMSNLAVLLYIQDSDLSKKIYARSVLNWEYRNDETNTGFYFIDIESSLLGEYLKKGRYQSETAFTLALALKEIKKWTLKDSFIQ